MFYRPTNLAFPHSAYEKLSPANKDAADCKADFEVDKRDIPLLLDALRILAVFQCLDGRICDGVKGLCIGWLHVHMPKTLLNLRKV